MVFSYIQNINVALQSLSSHAFVQRQRFVTTAKTAQLVGDGLNAPLDSSPNIAEWSQFILAPNTPDNAHERLFQ